MSRRNGGERCWTVAQQNYWRESFCEGKREIVKMQSLHLFHLFGFRCFVVVRQKQYDWAFDQEEDQHHYYDSRHHACAQMSMTWTQGVTWSSSEHAGSSYQWFPLTENGLYLHHATPNDLCAPLCDRKRICSSAMCRFEMAGVEMKYGLQKLNISFWQLNTAPKVQHVSMLIISFITYVQFYIKIRRNIKSLYHF